MKTLKLTLLAAAATLAMGGAAAAQESPVSFNLGVASDYVYRGVSQTDEGPQVFGGVDLAIGEMGYAGIWASNVDF
ncbi:MAG: TorF family putative porin, partial [Phenylobacterium sp.]|nr:TorF family putative porin [Phenylobacterium sp.]